MRLLSNSRDSLCSEFQDTKGYLGIKLPSVLPPEDWSTHIKNARAGSLVNRFTANHPVVVVT